MSVSEFYRIELERLFGEFKKISLFTKHPGTIGTYREQVLKHYLRNFIPKGLTINSGFVFDIESAELDQMYCKQTKQIDCLVYDGNNYTPFMSTEDFVIIDPRALYAGIEVKSSLTFCKEYNKKIDAPNDEYPFVDLKGKCYRWAGTLIDALENIQSLQLVSCNKRAFFKGIFAYSSKVDFHVLFHAFDCHEIQKQLKLKNIDELPTYICIPGKHLVYFGRVALYEDESMGFDPDETEMTVIEMVKENVAFSLQFFSNALKKQIDYNLFQKIPDSRGLFTAGLGKISYWNHHFRLKSK